MNKQPVISVITVVYNSVNTLEQTILSVINQTYKNIEYIIIDGNSTDGTIDIIKKYESKLAYWVSEPDKGIYDAMNKGVDKVTGEWINFMNAGDRFYSTDIIQKIADMDLFSFNNSILYGDSVLNYNGGFFKQNRNSKFLKYYDSLLHQSCFIYASLQKTYPFDISYKIAGDYDFFYKMINNKVNFIKINLIISIFLIGGISSINNKVSYKESVKVVKTNNHSTFNKSRYVTLCFCRMYMIYITHKYFSSLVVYLKLKLKILKKAQFDKSEKQF